MPKILLASDLDKTLLDSSSSVPKACLEAIRAYTEAGGLFTIATGRPTRGALIYSGLIDLVNAPMISYNGGCIYDTKQRRVLWQQYLPDGLAPLVRTALDRLPNVGALVFRGEDDYTTVTQPNEYTHEVTWNREHYRTPECALEDIPFPWNKIVMAGPPADMLTCAEIFHTGATSPITAVLTEEIFLEVNGANVGKALALRRVAEMVGIDQSDVIAIGDSMNDMSMIQWAGTGIVVANAEPEVAQIAKLIVASNDEHGLCECIEKVALPMLVNK